MKKLIFLFLPLLILATTCEQDGIFYAIFQEVAIVDPRVEGTPSNMVVFERNGTKALYVASGKIHWYSGSGVWDTSAGEVPQPGGKVRVRYLAVADEKLYALCLNFDKRGNVSTTLKYISKNGSGWNDIPYSNGKYQLQSVFAVNDKVFVGAMDGTKNDDIPCELLYLDGSSLNKLRTDPYLLNGVAYDGTHYYLSSKSMLKRDGDSAGRIYSIADASFPSSFASIGSTSKAFMSIINTDSTTPYIVAIDRDGRLYHVSSGSITDLDQRAGHDSAGALAVWRDTATSGWTNDATRPEPKLLLASIQGSLSYSSSTNNTNGYREIELNSSGATTGSFREPGDSSPSTTPNTSRYRSTIGVYPVYHMFQTPKDIDPEATLFASTSTKGLWSYRYRKGEWQWNAEE